MVRAERVHFPNNGFKWCFEGYDVSSAKWVQVRHSNLYGVTFTDPTGQHQHVMTVAKAGNGHRVNLGTGAREPEVNCLAAGLASAPQVSVGHECVSDALLLLVSSVEFPRIPQPSADLQFNSIKQIFHHSKAIALLKPSQWGILRDARNFTDSIEDLCSYATVSDKFIFRVTLPPPASTSLHCVAVRDREICDPATGHGWLPLAPASFKTLAISAINAGFKIVPR